MSKTQRRERASGEQSTTPSPSNSASSFELRKGSTSPDRAPQASEGILALGIILLAGLLLRLLMLLRSGFGIESDEAIVGLMAKHVLAGAKWPVFYYGQHYMGSFEALLVSLSFGALGQSNAALKLVPLLFSLLHIGLVYALARRFVPHAWALFAALLTALGPAALIAWGHKARGGFIELVVLGTLSLILAVDALRAQNPKILALTALGFVLGLGWWVNNQMIFYMLAIGGVFALYFPVVHGFKRSFKLGFYGVFGFFFGSLPFWYANLILEPRLATFHVLFGQNAGGKFFDYLKGFFTTALPIIFAARRFWSEEDVLPGGSLVAYASYTLVLFGVAFLPRSEFERKLLLGGEVKSRNCSNAKGVVSSYALLGLFCLLVPLIFAASSFGWLAQAPRYLLPLYSVLFVLAAVALARLWELGFVAKVLSTCTVGALFGLNITSCFYKGFAIEGQPFVYAGQRVADSHEELYAWLEQENYSHIHTNYWIGYRTAFETNERVTFTRYGEPRSLRIPEYEQRAQQLTLPLVYVLVKAEADPLAKELNHFGYSLRRSNVGEYVVLDKVRPNWATAGEVSLNSAKITASSRGEDVAKMIDGDLSSRWGTGMPQRGGMRVEVEFARVERISGVSIEYGKFVTDAPRDFSIFGKRADGGEELLFSLRGTKLYNELQAGAISEVEPRWDIYFAPREVKAISLRQDGNTAVFDWSMAELKVFAAGE